MNEEAKGQEVDLSNPVMDQYDIAVERCETVEELTEQLMVAIISLHHEGVSVDQLATSFGYSKAVINLLVAEREEGE